MRRESLEVAFGLVDEFEFEPARYRRRERVRLNAVSNEFSLRGFTVLGCEWRRRLSVVSLDDWKVFRTLSVRLDSLDFVIRVSVGFDMDAALLSFCFRFD